MYVTGAVFKLLSGERYNMIMERIETHFNHYVTEVTSWPHDKQFEDALRKVELCFVATLSSGVALTRVLFRSQINHLESTIGLTFFIIIPNSFY
uniref:Uncharacterized protein n=1 Tax=Lactuca sativa TaxID=4236 RepID=A0A9R1UHZ8_LACSA|nr:hypothetical protein LSAT_V11C900484230 [Lactuca sativa]